MCRFVSLSLVRTCMWSSGVCLKCDRLFRAGVLRTGIFVSLSLLPPFLLLLSSFSFFRLVLLSVSPRRSFSSLFSFCSALFFCSLSLFFFLKKNRRRREKKKRPTIVVLSFLSVCFLAVSLPAWCVSPSIYSVLLLWFVLSFSALFVR